MNKHLLPISCVLLLSACGAPKQQMDHDHGAMEAMDHAHHGEGIEVSGAVPTVDLVMHKDPKSGWNAEIITENFLFAPENASLDHKDGEGHAHIYVNDVKINRVYGGWYYLADAKVGDTVRVNLNANNHSPLWKDGMEIADEEIIE